MTPNWSDLLPEILNKITKNLNFYEDSINFLCVCRSWKSSITTTKNFIHTLPSQFPTLMLAESNTTENNDHQNHRKFFLLSNPCTVRKLRLPEAHRQRCVSTHGWLLTTGEQEFCAKLLHPISRTQIELPQLYMFDELYFDQDEWMYYCSSMRKVVFTSSNPLLVDPLFRVVIIWGQTIGFCRPGDGSWTRVNGSSVGQLFDITYHNIRKRLYVVASMGSIYECDVFNNSSSLSHVSKFPGQVFGCYSLPWLYLLEWGYNSLLMVTRERYYFKKHDDEYKRYGSYRTCKFQCYEFCLDDNKWTKVMSLGDKAIFLGFNSSFSINSGGGVKPDCIYFTDDIYDPFRDIPDDGGGDVGVYRMSDGIIESIFYSKESIFRCSPPLWLQSNTLPVLKKI